MSSLAELMNKQREATNGNSKPGLVHKQTAREKVEKGIQQQENKKSNEFIGRLCEYYNKFNEEGEQLYQQIKGIFFGWDSIKKLNDENKPKAGAKKSDINIMRTKICKKVDELDEIVRSIPVGDHMPVLHCYLHVPVGEDELTKYPKGYKAVYTKLVIDFYHNDISGEKMEMTDEELDAWEDEDEGEEEAL